MSLKKSTVISLRQWANAWGSAGVYTSPAGTSHPRLQILTIQELLSGHKIDMPPWHEPQAFKKAPKAKAGKKSDDAKLF